MIISWARVIFFYKNLIGDFFVLSANQYSNETNFQMKCLTNLLALKNSSSSKIIVEQTY